MLQLEGSARAAGWGPFWWNDDNQRETLLLLLILLLPLFDFVVHVVVAFPTTLVSIVALEASPTAATSIDSDAFITMVLLF